MSTITICHLCMTEIDATDTFCSYCGELLKDKVTMEVNPNAKKIEEKGRRELIA